jgi:glucans biosynthesis protein
MHDPSRRVFIRSACALAAWCALRNEHGSVRAQDGLARGDARPFEFANLVAQAKRLAAEPYRAPVPVAPEILAQLDYEALGKVHFKVERALFGEHGPYPATFFHLGKWSPTPVKIFELRAGEARELLYSNTSFDMPRDSAARGLPAGAGFAGFRLHESIARADWKTQDWVAFLGASYFRSIGAQGQYGLSARGVAVDTTAGEREEFPHFREFYLESARDQGPAVVYALLDGPSVAGAFRFGCHRAEGVVMDVDCQLFLRADVKQLGIAPMSSMFWYAEHNRGYRVDWRPEVHDSDGLAIWSGNGERLYRPLNNPSRTITSSFFDKDPKGFGLLQRDRASDHYLDGVRYERRPSLWVEPLDKWGKGSVQLVEIPTDDEIHDNVAAFWCPAQPSKAGASYHMRYRLHWQAQEPFLPTHIAQVAATRIGRGGQPGKPRPAKLTKFVVEFAGAALEGLDEQPLPKAQVSAARGSVSYVFVERVPETQRLRAHFDLAVEGAEPVELRLYLKAGERALSETWLYQFEPNAPNS